ncbi:NUDIX domain-containing protein [Antribacter sp. KLBMP9083]|uniref:NUDIX domain-containing protein n=1 Tax=Antribacter soli TaxID=2910976 RepID=A0AA41U9I3_9MICO|nr:NUDIX domain-containing protein [Antribacter soli]MCF4123570.1 NUDIX domain-containing protein [Antribacter soli]
MIPRTAGAFPVTVDVVALTVRDGALHVLLVERLLDPFRGARALPGGFVLPGESLEQAATRELAEETGVTAPASAATGEATRSGRATAVGQPEWHLEQLRTYGPQDRDPRGPVLSVAYLLLAPAFGLPEAGGDAAAAGWFPVPARDLAFDHDRILADGVERARAKLEYSPLATAFCHEEFTVAELRHVYEAVWGTHLDARNFHRKATGTPGFLEPTGHVTTDGPGRPAELYRLVPGVSPTAAVLHPPILRPAERSA